MSKDNPLSSTQSEEINPIRQPLGSEWRSALAWGFGIALAHRLLLGLWMALVWVYVAVNMLHQPMDYYPHGVGGIPALPTVFEQLALGIWRRWDARFYLNLACNGYNINDPGSTVFAPLTPLGIYLLDRILPGPVDVAGLIFGTLSFGLALTLLYRLCEVYYQDARLGQWAVALTALLPVSYFFSAPMSEAIYLAMVLAMFYTGVKRHWGLTALFGALAVLARLQGVVLVGVAGILLLEQQSPSMSWRERAVDALKKGWPLVLIPVTYLGFILYRDRLGLPSVTYVHHNYSYTFFVNPIEGLFVNSRWFITHLPDTLFDANFILMFVAFFLLLLSFRSAPHRRPTLVAYSILFVCLFISKLHWWYGTRDVIASIAFGRYALTLFPLVVLLADKTRDMPYWGRLLTITLLMSGLAVLSAQFVLGFGPS